jgi:hypothetical protein
MAVIDDYSADQDTGFSLGPRLFWLSVLAADFYFWLHAVRWCARLL